MRLDIALVANAQTTKSLLPTILRKRKGGPVIRGILILAVSAVETFDD
jgi:hypothetical protein